MVSVGALLMRGAQISQQLLAYLVNFNVPLSGFEPNIRTLRHLIDLALGSPHPEPPRLLFMSSAAVWFSKSWRARALRTCLTFLMCRQTQPDRASQGGAESG